MKLKNSVIKEGLSKFKDFMETADDIMKKETHNRKVIEQFAASKAAFDEITFKLKNELVFAEFNGKDYCKVSFLLWLEFKAYLHFVNKAYK